MTLASPTLADQPVLDGAPAPRAAPGRPPEGRRGRSTRRALQVLAAVGVLSVATATAASAHVHVVPSSTAADGSSLLTFRVPTESDTASTTKLTVDLPTGTPFASVSVQQLAGWTSHVEVGDLPRAVVVDGATLTRAPLHVTWTAAKGTGVAPGEFQLFTVSVSPLPAAGTRVVLPAHQTYSDGSVVDWTDVAAPGAAEPEHPAPELTTTAALPADDDGAAAPTVTSSPTTSHAASTPTPQADAASSDGSDAVARWLGGIGIALGLVAVVVTVTSRRRGGTS